MTIGTGAAIRFWNAATTPLKESGGSLAVADLAFSKFDTTDIDLFTPADDSTHLVVTLQFTGNTAPDPNSSVNLYARIMNMTDVPGTTDTNDNPIPSANYRGGYLGTFAVKDTTAEQFLTIVVPLPGTEAGETLQLGIENRTGDSINANWDLHVRARSIGPHA